MQPVNNQSILTLPQQRIGATYMAYRRGPQSSQQTQRFDAFISENHQVVCDIFSGETREQYMNLRSPDNLICPITQCCFVKPVRLSCNHIFEQHAIKRWGINHNSCPMRCGTFTPDQTDKIDAETKKIIDQFKERFPNALNDELQTTGLTMQEIKMINIESGGLKDEIPILPNINNFEKAFKYHLKGNPKQIILPVIFPTNNTGNDPFSSVFDLGYGNWSTFLLETVVSTFLTGLGCSIYFNATHPDFHDTLLQLRELEMVNGNIEQTREMLEFLKRTVTKDDSLKQWIDSQLSCLNEENTVIKDKISQIFADPEFSKNLRFLNQVTIGGMLAPLALNITKAIVTSTIGEWYNHRGNLIQSKICDISSKFSTIISNATIRFDDDSITKINECLDELHNLNPNEWIGWNEKSQLNYYFLESSMLIATNQFNKALISITSGKRYQPENPFLLYNQTIILLAQGKLDAVRKFCQSLDKTALKLASQKILTYLDWLKA